MEKIMLAIIATSIIGCLDDKPQQVITDQPRVDEVTLKVNSKTIDSSYQIQFKDNTYSHCEIITLNLNGQNVEGLFCPKGPAYTKQ